MTERAHLGPTVAMCFFFHQVVGPEALSYVAERTETLKKMWMNPEIDVDIILV